MTKKTMVFVLSHILPVGQKLTIKLIVVLLMFGFADLTAGVAGQDQNSLLSGNLSNTELIASAEGYIAGTAKTDDGIDTEDQQRNVTGRVTDAGGNPLPGVNILEKGTLNGVISDGDGRFSITIASPASVLAFSFVGYNTQEVVVGAQTSIIVTLTESAIGLDEIVVVGYGTQQRRNISGSVTNITEKSFNVGVTRTAVDMIQGKVAGLVITKSSGDITSQQSMRLRGTSSLTGSSEPFVVIDGVPGLSLNSVASQDIESISILKDASAAAIYGSRSASGVILITTKKGRAGQFTTEYNGFVAMDVVSNKPDLLSATEWRKYCQDNGLAFAPFDKGADTDWFGEIMRTGVTMNHDLSFSGGGTNNSYRVSISSLSQEGVVRDNYQNRLNMRFSVNQKALKEKLSLTLIGSITQRDFQPSDTRNFVLSYNMVPALPVKNPDGSWFESTDYDQGNPVHNIQENYDRRRNNINYFNLKADLEIVKNLLFSVNAYYQRQSTDRSRYWNSTTERGRGEYGVALRSFANSDTKLLENTLNYTIRTGGHNINILAGNSFEDNYYQFSQAQNRKFVTDLFGADNLTAGENMQVGDASSNASMSRLLSYFGRVNYGFRDRYILSATLRRDGSSKFGANNKWGTFPSVSAAWRIGAEPFMQSLRSVFDELKLRAGYGISGNQDGLASYQSMQLYGSAGTYYDNGAWRTAYAVNQNANPDLQWEQTAMSNVGLDFSIFNSRLNGTIEYYHKVTSKLLYSYQVPVPPYLYASMMANVGSMLNKGVELTLTGDIIRTRDLRWTMTVNGATNDNKITKLSDAEFTTQSIRTGSAWVRGGSANTTHIVEEGKQVGQFFGLECTGLDANGLYIINDMVDGVPGVTVSDYTYIGQAQPKLTYGIDNSISYKNFELSFFWRGVYGNDVLNFSKMSYATTQWLPGANVLRDALTLGLAQSPFYNSFYIEKGSFARLENITFGYTFNPNVLGIYRTRLYFTGNNLLLLTKYKGVDPEVPMSGLDPGVEGREYYPKSRTYVFGINVSF